MFPSRMFGWPGMPLHSMPMPTVGAFGDLAGTAISPAVNPGMFAALNGGGQWGPGGNPNDPGYGTPPASPNWPLQLPPVNLVPPGGGPPQEYPPVAPPTQYPPYQPPPLQSPPVVTSPPMSPPPQLVHHRDRRRRDRCGCSEFDACAFLGSGMGGGVDPTTMLQMTMALRPRGNW